MDEQLIDLLMDAGLIQYGYFVENGTACPYRLNLELLPAYPRVLAQIVDQIANSVSGVDRLLCDEASLPLGTGVSFVRGIPLVYRRASQLIGAYDVGHATALIVNVLDNRQNIAQLKQDAYRVGLHVISVYAVIAVRPLLEGEQPLLHLEQVTQSLVSQSRLSQGQGSAVLQWANLHPDSILP